MKPKHFPLLIVVLLFQHCSKNSRTGPEPTAQDHTRSQHLSLAAPCYSNPVQAESGDPYCFKYNNKFYIYRPNGKNVESYESTDLITWTNKQVVFTYTSGVWAPEVHQVNGNFYLYFAVPNPSSGDGRDIAAIRLQNPTSVDPSDTVSMVVNNNHINIDPTVYVEGNHAYLVWKYKLNDGSVTSIRMRELNGSDPKKFASGSTATTLLVGNENPFGAKNTEHPDLIREDYNDGGVTKYRYFLFFNNNRGDTENYRIEYATANNLNGPYTFKGILVQKDAAKGIYGPGGHSVVRDGSNYRWLVYRTKVNTNVNWNRQTCIDRLFVDAFHTTATCTPTMGAQSPYCPDPLQ